MTFYYHLRNFISLSHLKLSRTDSRILSEKTFHRILERERSRTDRYGDMFSLLIFDTGKFNGKQAKEFAISDIICQRVRPTDEVGWFKKARLGVILPSTPYKGALKLANDICQQIRTKERATAVFQIFSYPADRLGKIDKNMELRFIETNECVIKGFSEVQKDIGNDADIFDCNRLAEGSKPLFEQQMPWWKRGIDILGSLVGLVLMAPLFLAIAIFIKIVSPGPVFFTQKRIGYLGRPFTMFKFRTMRVNADTILHENHVTELIQSGQPLKKMDDKDPRIFPLGKFLRISGIDELPQLINVLRGEMSLVGPRPELPCSLQYCEPWHSRRFDTKPGLSGLWQISGKTTTTFNEMMRLDISYVNKRSFWLDMLIILKTFPTILSEARR
jgi:lipopolysaccharide/colanic/teichoic acid biosynthesis glycosyltransferase